MSQADTPVPAGEAGALANATAKLDSIFGLSPGEAAPEAPAEPPAPEAQAAPEPPAPEAPPKQEEQSLAALIRQQREDRAARQARESEARDAKARLAELEEKLSKTSKADMVADPIGFAELHGLTEDEMALVGQAYLYHLVPDKAPPDLRFKLLEAKHVRETKAREAAEKAKAMEQAQTEAAQRIQQYHGMVHATVESWGSSDSHPFPESQAWFGSDHADYTASLMHTANNIAESARQRGEVADLSPKAVAAALERDLSTRAARLRGSKPSQPSVKPEATEAPAAGKQPAAQVMSTRGQGASPAPKATSEEERIKRAMEVVFATR